MNWDLVQDITGHTIVFASLVGSKRFGLTSADSDDDYALFVKPGKDSKYDPNSAYIFHEAGSSDLFFHDVSELTTLEGAAGIYVVEMYGSVVYANSNIKSFFEASHAALANMCPNASFQTCKGLLELHMESGSLASMARSVRDCAFIKKFVDTEDMESSFVVEEPFLSLYRSLHSENCPYSVEDVRAMLQFMYLGQVDLWFRERKNDIAIFNRLQEHIAEYL